MSQIYFNNITQNFFLNNEIVEKLIHFIVNSEQYKFEEISLILADDNYINEMKKQYFNEDVFTDTITFNVNEENEPIEGEIYLSADRIEQNALDLNIEIDQECANVIIHSLLHLLGYEDYTKKQRQNMFAIQAKYLNKFNYRNILQKEN